MKSVHAQLLDRIGFQFGHQYSYALFVTIRGSNSSTLTVPAVTMDQSYHLMHAACHRFIVGLTDYELTISD